MLGLRGSGNPTGDGTAGYGGPGIMHLAADAAKDGPRPGRSLARETPVLKTSCRRTTVRPILRILRAIAAREGIQRPERARSTGGLDVAFMRIAGAPLHCCSACPQPLPKPREPAAPGRVPTAKDNAITVSVYMRDGSENDVMLGARTLARCTPSASRSRAATVLCDDECPSSRPTSRMTKWPTTWGAKGKVTKCSIYLEAPEAGVRDRSLGAVVGCEAEVASAASAATSVADPKHPVEPCSAGSQALGAT